ncbi:hypothetical protein KKF25_03335 [Patescibacteria group bacterium]|nr:hypothetical protein [Patescibacteria group bacterium]
MSENSNNQFALGKKWFWIGLVMGLNILSGLVFGIALTLEKERRKEGAIIIVFTIAWFIFSWLVLGPWLQKSGILPQYQLLRMN